MNKTSNKYSPEMRERAVRMILVKIGNFTAAEDKRCLTYVLPYRGIAGKSALTANLFNRKLTEYEALRLENGNDASLGAFEAH